MPATNQPRWYTAYAIRCILCIRIKWKLVCVYLFHEHCNKPNIIYLLGSWYAALHIVLVKTNERDSIYNCFMDKISLLKWCFLVRRKFSNCHVVLHTSIKTLVGAACGCPICKMKSAMNLWINNPQTLSVKNDYFLHSVQRDSIICHMCTTRLLCLVWSNLHCVLILHLVVNTSRPSVSTYE